LTTLLIALALAPVPWTDLEHFLWDVGLKALAALSLVLLAVAGYFWFQRKTLLDKIRTESNSVEVRACGVGAEFPTRRLT
jgi:hypothetical protein